MGKTYKPEVVAEYCFLKSITIDVHKPTVKMTVEEQIEHLTVPFSEAPTEEVLVSSISDKVLSVTKNEEAGCWEVEVQRLVEEAFDIYQCEATLSYEILDESRKLIGEETQTVLLGESEKGTLGATLQSILTWLGDWLGKELEAKVLETKLEISGWRPEEQ
ncbi:MAG: hypothetical protein DRN81_07565 [Thermoproteota archaeon]|nr:MAG: hypothetical protein DRN81_07565 [Candidatus Korarchaeota archaeon]